MKINMENRRTNIIVTSVILAVILAVGIITGINFKSFYNYSTEFVVRSDVVDEIRKLSDYSPSLKGTIGDSDIFVIKGTDNTVAVVRKSEREVFTDTEAFNSDIKVAAHAAQVNEVADSRAMNIDYSAIDSYESTAESAAAKVADGSADVALLSYKDAKEALKIHSGLAIADAAAERTPSVLVMGGTHPNEPSAQVTATLFLENAKVSRGTLYVITELNRSAYSYSQPQEGTPWYYELTTANGKTRTFKFGSRATNTVNQWPTPDVYTHSSGQQLSSTEVRNLNRAYPGSVDGTYTERVAYAVTNLINTNDITIEIDLHEASPEYLTNNAIVYHQDSGNIIAQAQLKGLRFQENGKRVKMDVNVDVSPTDMHGLTHRELGDYTNAYAFLFETSCAAIGRIHGAFRKELITYENGDDKFYEYLRKLQEETGQHYLYAYPDTMDTRVARHTLSVMSVVLGYNEIKQARTDYTHSALDESLRHKGDQYLGVLTIDNMPDYVDIVTNGAGYYLSDVD